MNNSNPTLRKAYKLLIRIRKKLNRPDLHFSAQIGVDSSKNDNVVTYAAMISPPREGLAPITFASLDKNDFIEKLKNFLDNEIDEQTVEIAYHEAQIVANERSTTHHQEQIEKIKNPEVKEAEIVEDTEKSQEEIDQEIRENGEK